MKVLDVVAVRSIERHEMLCLEATGISFKENSMKLVTEYMKTDF